MERLSSSAAARCARAGLLVVPVIAALALGVGTTSAEVVRLRDGARIGYQPLPGAAAPNAVHRFSEIGPSLESHGGPVMPSNTNYTIYWAPPKSAKYASKYTAGVNKYFKDIAHDSGGNQNTESVLTQYGAAYASTFGGQIKDKDPYPANGCSAAPICLTDEQLQNEIRLVVQSRNLPTDVRHEYFLLTPPGVETCAEANVCSANSSSPFYCAYHNFFTVPGGVIIYADDPYVYEKTCDEPSQHPNGPSDSALLGGLSHEHSESVTDPELDAWYNEIGEEIGDICRVSYLPEREFGNPLGTAPDGSPYNQLINKHRYWYQQEWSNEGGACKQRVP